MSNCKVLIADDVFANQFLLASMLEELSVGFKTVSNGKEVLDELGIQGKTIGIAAGLGGGALSIITSALLNRKKID